MAVRVRRFEAGGRGFVVASVSLPDLTRYGLTAAERDVCVELLDGRTYDEIAARRGTSVRTVANQARAVLEKVGARDRYALVAMVFQTAPTS